MRFARCLCNDSFKGSYVYRLFSLNGMANFVQYLDYMLTNQIGTLPNMNDYFTFLIDHKLGKLCQFLLLFSASAQSTFNIFISLIRLLSIVRSNQTKNNERVYFQATCMFAATLSIAVSVPVFFDEVCLLHIILILFYGRKINYMPVVYVCFFTSVAFALATFPFSLYSFARCLRNGAFKGCYIYRLIALNGIANCLQYVSYMITNQIGTVPNMNGYFAFLMDHKLAQLCQFSLLFSSSAQSTFNMCISLNRLLSIVKNSPLKNHDRAFFNAVCILASTVPIVVSIPVFFANCFFEPIISATGQTHYVAVVIELNLIAIGFLYFMGLGIMANVFSAILVYEFVKIRRIRKTAHSSTTTRAVYISLSFQEFVMTASGSLIIALYTGAPFWSLIIFVPSFRNCVLPKRATTSNTPSTWTTAL
uniref:G protein-coupled receptor n=1 Tax=Pristionchus pacificus TaxID=54126 RepID=A0A8R1UYK1_PRIPA